MIIKSVCLSHPTAVWQSHYSFRCQCHFVISHDGCRHSGFALPDHPDYTEIVKIIHAALCKTALSQLQFTDNPLGPCMIQKQQYATRNINIMHPFLQVANLLAKIRQTSPWRWGSETHSIETEGRDDSKMYSQCVVAAIFHKTLGSDLKIDCYLWKGACIIRILFTAEALLKPAYCEGC